MRILVLGSGAREHAIITSLRSEGEAHDIFAAPGNAGIARDVTVVTLDANDPVAVASFAQTESIGLVVIGPEAPLVAGVADALRERGIPTFGPGKAAAQLEGSKAFAKRIMQAAGVPTGRATHAATLDEVAAALDEFGTPHVVKADGLAAGKGVIVTDDRESALAHAAEYLGTGGVLVEEFLSGPEVSLFFLSDGDTVRALSPAQDFKRIGDGDTGPNTGGMGAYSPLPWAPAGMVDDIVTTVAQPVVDEMARRGTPFSGLLYCGLALTSKGLRVVEFNVRFGDPETQPLMMRMEGDLLPLLDGAARGQLAEESNLNWGETAVCVVLASAGYPRSSDKGRCISGLEAGAEESGVVVFHAGTRRSEQGDFETNGGRVLGVTARGRDVSEARERAYAVVEQIQFEGAQYRQDIGARALNRVADS